MNLRQNAYAWLLLTALIAVAGDWAWSTSAARWWRLPAALLLVGLAYESRQSRRRAPELTLQVPERWLLARPTPVRAQLLRHGPRPVELELAAEAPSVIDVDRRVIALTLSDQRTPVHWMAVARRLGVYRWPPLAARVTGPLGLAWWSQTLRDERALRVVPDMLDEREQATGLLHSGARLSARVGVGAQVTQLRAYRPGDPLRTIDWKSTARRRQLISRDYSEDQHLDVMVALDVGRNSGVWCGALDRLGYGINLSARLAQVVTAQDDRIGLLTFADRAVAACRPAAGEAGVRRVRALLSAVEVQPVDANPMAAAAQIRVLLRHRSLVLLLTDIEEVGAGGQLAAAVRLLRQQHLVLVVGLASDALEDAQRQPTRDWLDPYRALAAHEYRLRRERSLRALRSLGVPALVVRPQQFERAVFGAYAELRQRRRV